MEFVSSVDGWTILQLFILPVLLPLVVGLVTKIETKSWIKAVSLLFLSALTSFLTELAAAAQSGVEQYDIGQAVFLMLVTFVLSVGVHLGLLKPTGATAAVQKIGSSYSNEKTIELK